MAKALVAVPARSRRRREPSQAVMAQARVGGVANVEFTRPELRSKLAEYDVVQHCVAGAHVVKQKGDLYLPRPNATDTSAENQERYAAYLKRAVFYNVARRTLLALKGQIFLRDLQVTLPPSLDVLKLDATGENVTLEQVAATAAEHVLSIGRSGLHVDFPTTQGSVTSVELESGDVRPTITPYHGREIINWRKALRGARTVYTLIVVREDYTTADDGFETKTETQYKVMRLLTAADAAANIVTRSDADDYADALDNAVSSASDVYRLEVWRGGSASTGTVGFAIAEIYYPRGADGSFLNEIPFQFLGAEKNDDSVDQPPMFDLCDVNLGHYRNSADYEETSFLTGQPTPVVSGVTEEWNNNVLKGNIQLGSRGVIALPNGGTAQLLQAEANSVPFEAMQMKERQMVALGAKLVEQRQVQRTATEAQLEGTADTSILATIAQNISNGMLWALKKATVFTGDNPDSVTFQLNTEFDLTRMDPAERQQLLLDWQGGAIAFTEMRAALRRGGVATLNDEEARTAIEKDESVRNDALLQKNKILNANKPVGTQQNPAPAGE